MTIIEALKKLGKSLLGDNYTPTEAKTDSQIAETIEGISKAIDDAGGIGGGSGGSRIIELQPGSDGTFLPIEPNLPIEYFAGACIESEGQYSIIKNVVGEYDGQGNVIGCEFIVNAPNGTITCVYFASDGSISIAD